MYQIGLCTRCLDEVCSRCSTGGEGVINPNLVQIDGLTVCAEAPPGTSVPSSGTTVETLVVDKGYYRTSNQSHVVLECYQKNACTGGIAIETICAAGYKGPCKKLTFLCITIVSCALLLGAAALT